MGALWSRWFGSGACGSDAERPSSDPRLGTNVALAMPTLAVAAVWLSLRTGTAGFGDLGLWATLALALVAATFGRYPIELGPRTLYSLETPTVLVAGLVGGPLAGAVVGAAGGIGDIGGVWRRRLAYSGISALQGLAAGHAGLVWQDGRLGLLGAGLIGSAGILAVGVGGLVLVQIDRRAVSLHRIAWSAATDTAGLALSFAPALLMASGFATRPGLVVAAVASAAVTAIVASRFGEHREATASDRHQALLRDWLTGAASRAVFEVELERTRAGVLRGAHPAGLLVVDADRFKDVNDTHGHTAGDGVLRELVRRIERCAREGDLVARWGGEEFCVLAPAIGGVPELEVLAERIRVEIEAEPIVVGAVAISLTVSVGGTIVDGGLHGAAVFDHADRALYRAKRDRNATCVLPAPVADTPVAAAAAQRASANAA